MIRAISASPLIDRAAFAAKNAQGARIVADPARGLVQARGFQTLYEVPRDLQTALRLDLLDLHKAELDKGGPVLFDHSAVEWMADWMRWHWAAVSTRAWDAALAKAEALVKRYDASLHLESGPKRGYDGYNWLDVPNAQQTEELMRFLYGRFGIAPTIAKG
jgi:hypothetical protein